MMSLLSLLDNQRQDIPLAAFLRCPISRLDKPEDALARIRLAYPPADGVEIPFIKPPFVTLPVPAGADLHNMIRRPSPIVGTALDT